MTNALKGNVLFVDDDKFLADMYGMKFAGAGYGIHTCLSVSEALEALHGGFAADAIVFDILMPERDGFSLLETLKSERLVSRAALIALTNQSDDAEKRRAESLGVDRYIVKATMIPSEVVHAVEEEVAKKKKTAPPQNAVQ